MEFGIEKCAMPVMKISKRHMTDGMDQPNPNKNRTLGEEETYKKRGYPGGWHHHTSENERYDPERISQEN